MHTHKRVRTRTQTIFLLALRHVSDMRVAEPLEKCAAAATLQNERRRARISRVHAFMLYISACDERVFCVCSAFITLLCNYQQRSGESEGCLLSQQSARLHGGRSCSCSQGRAAQPLLTRLLTGACQQHPGSMPRIIFGLWVLMIF
jgi:hypothetical protein